MRVGVIMGGVSSEREVSRMTGKEMAVHLDRRKYEVLPIEISRREELIDKVREIDFALLALHGAFGEDGTVQGVLETLGIPYPAAAFWPAACVWIRICRSGCCGPKGSLRRIGSALSARHGAKRRLRPAAAVGTGVRIRLWPIPYS